MWLTGPGIALGSFLCVESKGKIGLDPVPDDTRQAFCLAGRRAFSISVGLSILTVPASHISV